MRLPFEVELSVRALPPGRLLLVSGAAVALAVADALPETPDINPDILQFALAVALGLLAIAMSIRDRVGNRVLKEWRNRALLSLFALAVSIVAAEPLTRALFRNVTTTSDYGGFFSRRWLRSGAVSRNHAGFRDREFAEAKPDGVYRIAVVGDSFTFGNGIRQDERYSELLRTNLPSRFEVLNFGTPGANLPQHRSLVADLLPRIQPDFVLLQWYVNDMEADDVKGRPAFAPLMPIRSWHDWLNERSALYSIANTRWAEAQIARGKTRSYSDYLRDRLGDPNGHDAQVDRQIMMDLIALCRRANVPIGIVLFPDTTGELGPNYEFAYLHERVLDICRAEDLQCVDLEPSFARVKDHRLLWANRLDHHPSALANEIAAVKVLEAFSRQWAAPPQGNAAH
jgi:hypothetical protein